MKEEDILKLRILLANGVGITVTFKDDSGGSQTMSGGFVNNRYFKKTDNEIVLDLKLKFLKIPSQNIIEVKRGIRKPQPIDLSQVKEIEETRKQRWKHQRFETKDSNITEEDALSDEPYEP